MLPYIAPFWRGGAEQQAIQTALALTKLGVDVDVFSPAGPDPEAFDVAHLFGYHVTVREVAKHLYVSGIPFLISPIYWCRKDPGWKAFLRATRRAIGRDVLRNYFMSAELLLPNSYAEARLLAERFRIPSEKIRVIYQGIGPIPQVRPELFRACFGIRDEFALTVGHIYPDKNHLGVVRALAGTGIPLVVAGRRVDGKYEQRMQSEAAQRGVRLHLVGEIRDRDLLASAYAACRVFVLASFRETPGLAALEAAASGAEVVITTEGSSREYFGDHAWYCDPHDVDSIRAAILSAWHRREKKCPSAVLQKYTWDDAAKQTRLAYEEALKKMRGRRARQVPVQATWGPDPR